MKNGLIVEHNVKRWYKDGKLHREDGPAVELTDGYKGWYKDNQYHREDGPAREFNNGYKEWWYKGLFVGGGDTPDSVLWERLTSNEVNGGPLLNGYVVDLWGDKRWYRNGRLHREDGPAVEYTNGRKYWYFNGEHLGSKTEGFWKLWDRLTDTQRGNPTLLKHLPRSR